MNARALGAGFLLGLALSVLVLAAEAAIVPPLAHFLEGA